MNENEGTKDLKNRMKNRCVCIRGKECACKQMVFLDTILELGSKMFYC